MKRTRHEAAVAPSPSDDILDSLFHGFALAAWLDQAVEQQSWPDEVATRQRAFAYYEDALAEKNRRRSGQPLSDTRCPIAEDVAA